MKRFALFFLLSIFTMRMMAFSYEDAREQAWYLTDKMAYELNLTPDQYDRAYEINLEYFLNVNHRRDIRGIYWDYRDMDLRCILYDWQYTLYRSMTYFYRPISWRSHRFYFSIFSHYGRDYYYYARPEIYYVYTGGYWNNRHRYDPSPYHGITFVGGGGMRDNWDRMPRPAKGGTYAPAPSPSARRAALTAQAVSAQHSPRQSRSPKREEPSMAAPL